MNNEEFLWFQKYRPSTIDECILPNRIKIPIKDFIQSGQIPHLIMFGGVGIGKTTLSYAIANEIDAEVLYINASNESGIDTIRSKVIQYCSTISMESSLKIVIMDEADRMTRDAMQILRPVLEQFSKTCRFIFTGNSANGLHEALDSRCATIDFTITKEELPKLCAQFLKRLKYILDNENVTYDDKVLVELIKRYFPNMRKVIGEAQKYASNGTIDEGALSNFSNDTINELIEFIKNKKFTDARKWLNDNSDIDTKFFYRSVYDICSKKLEPSSIPELVLILAKYQFQGTFGVDSEINNGACIVEMMSNLRFK